MSPNRDGETVHVPNEKMNGMELVGPKFDDWRLGQKFHTTAVPRRERFYCLPADRTNWLKQLGAALAKPEKVFELALKAKRDREQQNDKNRF